MKYWRKPLDADTIEVPRGRIHVLRELCKGCGFCVEYCPRRVLELSEGYNKKGYHTPVAARIEDCVSCGLCELICPEFAIYATLIDEQGAEKPVSSVKAAGAGGKSEV